MTRGSLKPLAALVTIILGCVAFAVSAGNNAARPASTPIGVDCSQDGSSEAPAGEPQHPDLLKVYGTRPPCEVAGVDYHVGIAAGTRLKDPSVEPWGGTLLYAPKQHAVRCTGPGDGVIDGYDFSLHDGLAVLNVSCSKLTIRNSKFLVGANCIEPISAYVGAANMTIIGNEIDGGGASSCDSDTVGETVNAGGGGTIVFRYNWVKNVPQHFVSFGGGKIGGGRFDDRYNLEERCGFFQGNHCNGVQIVGGVWTNSVVAFNTIYSPQPDTALSAGGRAKPTGIFVAGRSVINGVSGLVLGRSGANSLHVGQTVVSDCLAGPARIVAPLGVETSPAISVKGRALRTGVCAFDVLDAYPSGIVNPIRYAAQMGSTLRGGVIAHNTVINSGPINTASYAVYCVAEPDHTYVNAVYATTISDNYMDDQGAFGTYYTGPGACAASEIKVGGNVEMKLLVRPRK